MGLHKGQTNNASGRKKGVPNKVTTELRVWIQSLIDDNREMLEADLMAMEPVQRWAIIEKLMQYTTPKQQSVAVSGEVDLRPLPENQLDELAYKILNHGKNKK